MSYLNHLVRKFSRDRKGMSALVIGGVIAMVVTGILLMIGVTINSSVHDAMPEQTGVANTTIESITTSVYGGYQLGTVIPTVLAASIIISAIVGGFMYFNAKR